MTSLIEWVYIRNLVHEIVILIMAGISLVLEALKLHQLRTHYTSSIFNVFDVLTPLLTMAFIGLILSNEPDTLKPQWLACFIILFGYLRWVSYLRFFESTRNLIDIIINIIRDMYEFVIVLIFIFFGFALVALEFNNAENPYLDELYGTYKILYANYDDTTFSVSQKIITSSVVFLMNVVLLNLLISIMGDSYDKIQERRILTDALTRLDMSVEAMVVMRVFNYRKKTKGKGYLIYCEVQEDEDVVDKENNEWEGRISVL